MKYRHEKKYLLSYNSYLILKQRLKPILKQDINVNENGEYKIASLYFDDIYNSALETKLNGVQNRKKYRIRIYNDSLDKIKFEKKIKRDSYIAKVDFNLNKDELHQIKQNTYKFLESKGELGKEIYYETKHKFLRPKVMIVYEREPYIHKVGQIRITFDKNLRYSFKDLEFSNESALNKVFKNNEVILEIKYNEIFPTYLKSLFSSEDLQQLSLSKYVLVHKNGEEDIK